jgi:flagellar motor switch protein FliG
MGAFTSEERLALLLSVLGDDIANVAFASMNPVRATYVKKLLQDLQSDPPSPEEIEYVIGDFNQYFRFAMDQLRTDLVENKKDDNEGSESKNTITYFARITPSDDPVHDLNRLDPYQIARALDGDHPKTIALVLRNMETKRAAKVLELLPDGIRSEAVIFLSRESTVPTPIVNQVLKSTVLKAITVEFREETVDQAVVLAELMRSLPKEMRVELMVKLEESDEELAAQVKTKLYLFDDVLRLDDRDVQKVLGEVESDSLIVALQRTDEAIIEKLLNNLSKRARESILEEMEYKENVSDEEIEEARSQVVGALSRLDESGDIKL